jgi:hypothetical protein
MTLISKETLIQNGWKETNDPLFPLEKDLTEREEGVDDDGKISLVVHGMNNAWRIGLSLPDGMVNIVAESVEELNQLEKMIASYEPNF